MSNETNSINFSSNVLPGDKCRVSLNDSTDMALVWCPSGSFYMGSLPDGEENDETEQPRHEVVLTKGYWIGETPVTYEQWRLIMNTSCISGKDIADASLPYDRVSWRDALEFGSLLTQLLHRKKVLCAECVATLPTEAQWEYSCRAGTSTPWFFGSDPAMLNQYAWFNMNSGNEPKPVGGKLPNPWGVLDMYGNVSEWCLDSIYMYSSAKAVDPINFSASESYKIVRGGDCTDIPSTCRSSCRVFIPDDNPHAEDIGFRIVVKENYTISGGSE